MPISPKRNLAPESEPWGRSVDQRLDSIEKYASQYQQDTKNALSGVNSTASKLSDQVAAIQTLTEELQEQQSTLEAQQAQLSAQVAQIQDLVNSTILSSTLGLTTSGHTLPAGTTYNTVSSHSITVPAGFTKATVFAVCTLMGDATTGSSSLVAARPVWIVPAGVYPGTGYSSTIQMNTVGTVRMHTKGVFTGLNTGDSVTLQIQAWATSGLNNVTVDPDAIILFTR